MVEWRTIIALKAIDNLPKGSFFSSALDNFVMVSDKDDTITRRKK